MAGYKVRRIWLVLIGITTAGFLVTSLWGGRAAAAQPGGAAVGLPAGASAAGSQDQGSATLTLPNGLSDPQVYDAVRTLTQAGIFQFQAGEDWLGQWPVSRDEVALWLHRLLQHLGQAGPNTAQPFVLSEAAQAQLRAWVAQEVAAALAAAPVQDQATQHVVEREVVVQAGPTRQEITQIAHDQAAQAVGPVLEKVQAAAAQAAAALASAAQAQAQAAAGVKQNEELQAKLQTASEELQAAQQAVGALQQRVAQLEQVQSSLDNLVDRLNSLANQLQELQTALDQTEQRLTGLDLRSASSQGDVETLRNLIDQRAEALAQQMGVDRDRFSQELQAARDRLTSIEKDYVHKEALAAVEALVNSRTAQVEAAIQTLAAQLQPELTALGQRLAAVEKATTEQGERLSQVEARLSTRVRLNWEWQGRQVEAAEGASQEAATAAGFTSGGMMRQSIQAQLNGPGLGWTEVGMTQETGTGRSWQSLDLQIPLGGATFKRGQATGGVNQLQAIAGIEGVPAMSMKNGSAQAGSAPAVYWKTGVRYQVGSAESNLGLEVQAGTGGASPAGWWQAQAELLSGPMQLRGWWGQGGRGTLEVLPVPMVASFAQPQLETGFSGQLQLPVAGQGRLGAGLGWLSRYDAGGNPAGSQREGWLALEWPVGRQAWLALSGKRWWGGNEQDVRWQAGAWGMGLRLAF
ncbi:MAG: hypothetical protein IMX01_05410 [Limnochordaceae bacterium]|nr:hypothetical protein [Limnochordaceae bacterium]